jgi:hypothetical protein
MIPDPEREADMLQSCVRMYDNKFKGKIRGVVILIINLKIQSENISNFDLRYLKIVI